MKVFFVNILGAPPRNNTYSKNNPRSKMDTTIIKRKRPVVALKMKYINMPFDCLDQIQNSYETIDEDVDNPVLLYQNCLLCEEEHIDLYFRIYHHNTAFNNTDIYFDLLQGVENIFFVLLIPYKWNHSESEKEFIYNKYRSSQDIKGKINTKVRELCELNNMNPNKAIVFIQ